MDVKLMLSELKSERNRIDVAIAAVEALAGTDQATPETRSVQRTTGKRSRNLTAAGRKRLSENMKRRWAERKRAASRMARAA